MDGIGIRIYGHIQIYITYTHIMHTYDIQILARIGVLFKKF
jgi:hypothetical protein